MAKEEEATEAEAKGGGKKKIIIIAVPVLLVLAAVYVLVLKPHGGAGKAAALPPPKAGVVVPLDPITVNLADGHFLKLGMALQPTASAKTVDGSKALDLAITEFSGRTMADLSSDAGRSKAKDALIARIELAYLPDGKVTPAETIAADKKVSGGKVTTDAGLTDAQAIKRAAALTVQPEVYDIYLTTFVMQ